MFGALLPDNTSVIFPDFTLDEKSKYNMIYIVLRMTTAGWQIYFFFQFFSVEDRLEDWTNDVEERIQFGVDFGKRNG